ncbi:hypothetical protein ISF_00293 [Cordyceps fumosorosea ARSEF 2679]|uniref:Domain of unknown function at the cortex 1 domain-containing protein n=1 Tax=Cordyceps fumosorosea (strain ARSEF 2679) TaxID=1081104 RepID=A0A162JT53_CORFA|nr:hypothetical protein ISF_00293 [Cordyceps fumosorosea ARSEF 2679]OAA73392.1 hypothetical protein ISF_00293 [Cordyceps fumosorosea ARSEF 2679]
MADKYVLRVTAGSSYDESTHVEVPVNRPETVRVAGTHAVVELNVRVQGYAGLPRGSPSTSPYFAAEPHASNRDQYSISFRFTPTRSSSPTPSSSSTTSLSSSSSASTASSSGISGVDLQFGNDFDRPIRDRLPPGFNFALRIVRRWIDPGLEGDAYADRPHLYGPALSSFNVLQLGEGEHDPARGGLWFEEGGDGAAALGLPNKGKERMKWALTGANKERFVFEYGKTYGLDFFNPYLDFANLALRLPGFQVSIASLWDGQPLRYVLRNKATGHVYLVVLFSLFLREDVNDDGTLKEGAKEHVIEYCS